MTHKTKLNLGCGKEIKKDYINMDIEDFGQEIVRDANKGLPFSDDSLDEVYAKHTIEHMVDIEFVLDECYRVLKKGGLFYIEVPHKDCDGAYDYRHKHLFTKETIERIAQDYGYKIKNITVNHKPYINAKLIK